MTWRDLLPSDAIVVLTSNGTFELEKEKSLGVLVLTHKRVYILLSKGIALQSPWMHADVFLRDVHHLQITGKLVRSLEFDYVTESVTKHVKFTSIDAEVREIMEKIAYEIDNPRSS